LHISNPLVGLIIKFQHIQIGKNCKFYGMPIIVKSPKALLKIGEHLILTSCFIDNLIGLYQRSIIFARDNAEIIIGDNVSMSGVTIYSFKKIVIGNNTSIGANTKIFDSDFHPIDPNIRLTDPDNKEFTKMKDTIIGNNVFIGCNCLILKGVHIGDNSVIGAGSVVTKDVPNNCIAAGNPATIVKRL